MRRVCLCSRTAPLPSREGLDQKSHAGQVYDIYGGPDKVSDSTRIAVGSVLI